MALLEVWADTIGKARCRSCQTAIEWAELVQGGKKMPFDGEIVAVKTRLVEGRSVWEVNTDVTRTHFSTCPDAGTWRRTSKTPRT